MTLLALRASLSRTTAAAGAAREGRGASRRLPADVASAIRSRGASQERRHTGAAGHNATVSWSAVDDDLESRLSEVGLLWVTSGGGGGSGRTLEQQTEAFEDAVSAYVSAAMDSEDSSSESDQGDDWARSLY